MIEEPMKPQSVFQNKEQRIHLELQNPFPISTLSEAHIETLKQMFQLPGIPTHLLVGLFSLNQNSNLRAIRFIRTKLNKASELSDILFKWSFTIGWFRESVQLQSEILQFLNFLLFQLKQENYEIHSTEIRIIKGYLHMLVYLLCRSSQSLFAQRTIPIVMQILHSTIQLPAMFLQTRDTIRFDDDDEINKVDILRRTKAFIEQIGLRLNDWSVNDCARNRQIVSDLICSISSLKQTPVQPPIQHAPIQQYQQTTSFGQQKQPRQFTPTHVCIPTQPTTPAIVIEEEVSVKRARSFSPLNRYQQVVPTIQPLNKQRSEHYHVVSEQVRQFQVMTRQFGGNDPKVNSCHLIDLAITIGVTLFQLRDQDLITEYCTELGNLMQNDLQSLPYQKFFELISWMFNQMLSEVKSKDNNLILSKLNGAMVRILTGSDVTNIYLALMDTILRERSTNTNAQSLSQQISLATRCLNKVLSNESAKKLPLQSLSMILDRFNDYLSKFCQFPDGKPPDVTRRGDDILAKAMKTAILIFVKNSGPGEILHVLEQLRLGPSSHLNRWVMEQVDENEEKQVGTLASKRYSLYRHQNLTDPAQIRGVLEGLARNDEYFEKNLDLLITFLKRNKGNECVARVGFDWKSQLPNDHPRLGYMEERIELATMDLNVKLEKKVVELTSLKETMNQ